MVFAETDVTQAPRASGAPRGRRQPSQRLTNILDAAECILSVRGTPGFSIDTVAEAAGIAKGTVYHYFASRELLLSAVVDRHACRLASAIKKKLAGVPEKECASRLRIWVEDVCGDFVENYALYGARPAATWGTFPLVTSLAALLCRPDEELDLSAPASQACAVFLFAGLRGCVEDSIARDRFDETTIESVYRHFLMTLNLGLSR